MWVLAILCVAYWPLFFGEILFFRDIAHWNFPARAFLRDALAAGKLPTWNPYQGLGFPVFGDPLYGPFYPPNWLFALTPPGWVASMLNWQGFAHLAWGALGMCLLARRLGASSRAMVVTGTAWALSGYTTSQWTSGLLLFADAWVPWACVGQLALLASLRAGGFAWRRGVVKAALPTMFAVLLGEVFLAMIGAGFALVFVTVVDFLERRSNASWPKPRLAWLGRQGLAVALGFGVGAVVIVPARMLLGGTERAAPLSRALAESCSLHPLRLLEFAMPQSMGDAYGEFPAAAIIGESRLDGLPLSYSMYVGGSVLVLVLAALGRKRRLAQALAALALLALLLAFGKYTPVHGLFRHIAIPLAYMRYPEKYTVLFVAMLALLAGLGADRVFDGGAQPWRRGLVLLGLVIALGLGAAFVLPPIWLIYAIHGALLGGLAVLGMLAAQLLAHRGSRLAPAFLVALVALDLAAAAWPLQGFGPRDLSSAPSPAAKLALDLRTNRLAPPRLYRSNLTSDAVNRWVPANSNSEGEFRLVQTLVTNTVNAWGIATLPGYDAAIPAKVNEVWQAGLDVGQSALRLLAADYAILPVADPHAPPNDRPGLEPVADPLPGARLYRVPGALPRVFLAQHVEILSDAQALKRIYAPEIVAGETALLAPGQDPGLLSSTPGRAGDCELLSYDNEHLVARCKSNTRALAIFVEQFDPGWRATVDGRALPVLRANLVMRAVPVEAGTHVLVLDYKTPGLAAGAWISLMSLLMLALLWIVPGPRGRVGLAR